MANKVIFVSFSGGDWGNRPSWIRPCVLMIYMKLQTYSSHYVLLVHI